MVNTNLETFKKEVLSNNLVLVDFYATWCGPCKMLAPIIEEIDRDYKNVVKVLKVNVDEQRQLAMEYNISSIPTLIIFKGGNVVNRMMGFRPKQALLDLINNSK